MSCRFPEMGSVTARTVTSRGLEMAWALFAVAVMAIPGVSHGEATPTASGTRLHAATLDEDGSAAVESGCFYRDPSWWRDELRRGVERVGACDHARRL